MFCRGMICATAAGGMYVCSHEDGVLCASAAGDMPLRSNMLRLAYADSGSACKHASRRRTRETMCVFAAVCLARICLRLQPLESSLGRVPQTPD